LCSSTCCFEHQSRNHVDKYCGSCPAKKKDANNIHMMRKNLMGLHILPDVLYQRPLRQGKSLILSEYAVVFHEFPQPGYHPAGSQAAMLGLTVPEWVGCHGQCVLIQKYIINNVCENLHYRVHVAAYIKKNNLCVLVHNDIIISIIL
jgi:hypothetical protein